MGSLFCLMARSMKWQSGPCLNRPHGPKLSFTMFLRRHPSLLSLPKNNFELHFDEVSFRAKMAQTNPESESGTWTELLKQLRDLPRALFVHHPVFTLYCRYVRARVAVHAD